MSLGLLILAALEGYRAAVRSHHKRRAKKYGYDNLAHDHMWRPVDTANGGRRLSRNEARALAQHRREMGETKRAQQAWLDKGNTLPDYGQVQRADSAERQRWQGDGSEGCEVVEDDVRLATAQTASQSGRHSPNRSTAAQTPEAELLRMSWTASPPYSAAHNAVR